MVPASNKGDNDEDDMCDKEKLVVSDANRQDGKTCCQAKCYCCDNSPELEDVSATQEFELPNGGDEVVMRE